MKTSIHFYPNTSKKSKKTGKTPLYLRIIAKGNKAEARLNLEASEADLYKWNPLTMRFNGKASTNTLLNTYQYRYEQFIYNNVESLGNYNATTIRDIIIGIEKKADPQALEYVDKYFQNVVLTNGSFENTTIKGYRKAYNHFKSFLIYRSKEKLLLSNVDNTIALEFKDYLLGNIQELGKKSMTEPSALSNVKKLRTIFDRACDEGFINSNPFKKIKLKSQSPLRARLDIHQVRKIYHLDTSEFPTQQLYKDLFLFSIFTGLAYIDAMALKQSDLYPNANGEIRLFMKRKKTDIITEMFLPEQANEILRRYKNSKEANILKAALPIRSNKEINVQLKILANMLNIPIKLSTHIARHTFRQLLAEADITDMGVIKKMMGHSSRSDIDGTYYSVTETRLIEAKRKFELFLTTLLQ